MKQEQYTEITNALMERAEFVEESKRPAYTVGSDDVLANFNRIAAETGMRPSQVCIVYWLKHVDSIRSMVRGGLEDPEPPRERFVDAINYTRLLYACLVEEKGMGEMSGTTTENNV